MSFRPTQKAPHVSSAMSSAMNSAVSSDLSSEPASPGLAEDITSPHPTAGQPRMPPLAVALLIFSVLWCVLWCIRSWGYWEDDSFIHLEFARSLANGHGFSFNGKVVYGDTAPLWVILLAGMHLLVASWLVGGKILSILGVVFTLPAVYVFSRRVTEAHPSSRIFSAAMVLLLVVNPYFCYWSFSGMETVGAAGLALWTVVAATSRPLTWQRFLISCALAGIAPLLRPELVIFTVIIALLLLYRRFLAPSGESISRKAAGFVAGFVLLCGPSLAWAVYAVDTFGRVIPNTNAAKRAPIGSSVTLRLLNVYSLGFPIILLGLLAAVVYLVLNASNLREHFNSLRRSTVFTAGGWVFVLWTAVTLTYYVVNHTYVQTRYILVSAVGLSIVVLARLLTVSARTYRFCVRVSIFVATAISVLSVWRYIGNKGIFVEVVRQQALFMHQLPPDALVADYNIGEVAFFSEHPILDTGGITRPGAIPYLNLPFNDLMRWIHSEGGAYMVYGDQPEPGAVLVLSQPFPYVGWSLDPREYSRWEDLHLWKLVPPNASATPAPAMSPAIPQTQP